MENVDLAMALTELKKSNEFGYAEEWYKTIKSDLKKAKTIEINKFYTFVYRATTKVDFYDAYPLAFILDIKHDGFLGLNFHHLSKFKYRKESIINLLENLNNLPIDYKNILYSKGIIRRYKYKGIIPSIILEVDPKHLINAIRAKIDTIVKG